MSYIYYEMLFNIKDYIDDQIYINIFILYTISYLPNVISKKSVQQFRTCKELYAVKICSYFNITDISFFM